MAGSKVFEWAFTTGHWEFPFQMAFIGSKSVPMANTTDWSVD